jgi:hypothetical protein
MRVHDDAVEAARLQDQHPVDLPHGRAEAVDDRGARLERQERGREVGRHGECDDPG